MGRRRGSRPGNLWAGGAVVIMGGTRMAAGVAMCHVAQCNSVVPEPDGGSRREGASRVPVGNAAAACDGLGGDLYLRASQNGRAVRPETRLLRNAGDAW